MTTIHTGALLISRLKLGVWEAMHHTGWDYLEVQGEAPAMFLDFEHMFIDNIICHEMTRMLPEILQ